MLELKTKERKNLYLEVDGDRQWVRNLDFAVRIGTYVYQSGRLVKLIETVRLWDVTRRPAVELSYYEYDRSDLLKIVERIALANG